MSKKIEVTVYRRTFSTYEVEVPDDFDVKSERSARALEHEWFDSGAWDWELVNEETANWEIDYIGEIR